MRRAARRRHGEDDLRHRLLGVVAREEREEGRSAEGRERPAELVREEDDDGEGNVEDEGPQNRRERRELQERGHGVDGEDREQPQHHLDGARSADQAEQPVRDEGDDQDVERVAPGEVEVGESREPAGQGFHHSAADPAGDPAGEGEPEVVGAGEGEPGVVAARAIAPVIRR